MEDRLRTITLRLDADFHKRLKLTAIEKGITMSQYILDLVRADVEKQEKKKAKA